MWRSKCNLWLYSMFLIFFFLSFFYPFFPLQSLVMCCVRVRFGPVSNCTKWLNSSGWCYIIRCIIYVYVWLMIQSCDITWIYSWVPINSTGKVCNGWIRNLGSIPAYTKNRLMSWSDDKELSSGADAIRWNFLKKKKKKSLFHYLPIKYYLWYAFHNN